MASYLNNRLKVINTLQSVLTKLASSTFGISTLMVATIAQGQTSSGTISAPNLGNFFPGQVIEIKPIQPPSYFFDSRSGSQQFFQPESDQLYFLPQKESESILQIDEELDHKNETVQSEEK